MAKDDTFFQFPLCLLQLNVSAGELVQHIADYCLADRGQKLREGGDIGEQMKAAKEHLHISGGSDDGTMQTYHALLQHQRQYEQRAGPDVLVRLRRDIIWTGLNEGGLSMREFRVLTGLYAAIGGKSYGPVALERLRYLAAGYKSKTACIAINGRKRITLFTDAQLKYTRNALRELKWFAAFHDGRRVYYSLKLDAEKLKNAVSKRMQLRQKQRGRAG